MPPPQPQRMLEEVLPRLGKTIVTTSHVSVGGPLGRWVDVGCRGLRAIEDR